MRGTVRRAWVLGGIVVALLGTSIVPSEADGPAANDHSRTSVSTVAELGVANVFPTWGAQIPKVIYDGHWYYATTLDGSGTEYPWHARIWKSRNGKHWTEVWELVGHVYQPPGLVLDAANDVFLEVGCYTGAECYPGVAPAPGADMAKVYTVRLLLQDRNPDGSIDFTQFTDYSLRSGTTERYYMGMAVDANRRYVYTAYAVGDWGVWFNVFDTATGTDVSTKQIGTPPAGHAWLYFRIQPGSAPGEIFLSFEQYQLGTPNSAYLDAALLLRSTDGGLSFPESHVLASSPNTDGDLNYVDTSDLTLDSEGVLNVTFFRRVDGVDTLYYQHGVDGDPVAVGPLNNHSQLVVDADGTVTVFGSLDGSFAVATSTDGTHFDIRTYPAGDLTVIGPNLLRSLSGSLPPPHSHGAHPAYQMLASGMHEGSSAFTLLFVTYH